MDKALSQDVQSMSGLNRTAILLMSLGEDYAAEILKHMEQKDLQRIGTAMTNIGPINKAQVSEVLHMFNQEIENQTSMGVDSHDYVRTVLVRALGRDKAKVLLDGIMSTEGTAASGVEALRWMEPGAIAAGLRKEHPQVVALVLSYLDSEQGAEVLGMLPEDMRYDVVMRIATLDSVPTGALTELNDLIEKQMMGNISASTSSKIGGPKRAAELLNLLDGEIESAIMERLKSYDPALGERIEDLMVVFDHLLHVDDRGIQTLLREISSETLMVALRGADDAVRDKILRNMSKRAAEMLRDDLEVMPPVRIKEVEAAQKEVMANAKRLAEAGELILATGKGSDSYV